MVGGGGKEKAGMVPALEVSTRAGRSDPWRLQCAYAGQMIREAATERLGPQTALDLKNGE